MTNAISVQTDIEDAIKKLSTTPKAEKSIAKQTLGIIGKGTAKRITSAIKGSGLQNRTGELAKGFIYKVKKDGSSVTVYPNTTDWGSKIFPKAYVLSFGHSGSTTRAKSFTVEARGFIQSGRTWAEAGGYKAEVDKMVDKVLNKYFGD